MPGVVPLFVLTLRSVGGEEKVQLDASTGWERCEIRAGNCHGGAEIQWRDPTDERFAGVRVDATARCDDRGVIRWSLKVGGVAQQWSVWRVRYPQLAVADLGAGASVLFPRGAGEEQREVWNRSFSYRGHYPDWTATMQLTACYDKQGKTGLYVAMHDPLASTKEILVHSQPKDRAVVLFFEHPAPNMGVGGNGFELCGEGVWQILHGDWFDAAVIYRDWVRANARWYPKLGPEGRADTPLWMRRLPAWIIENGTPQQCEPKLASCAAALGVPLGFHWYNWHEIPFDNDYPHYFPAKAGFAEAVRRLQASGVSVMPYINGRLWDSRDKGTADFEFSRIALPAATKDEQGKPRLERYGSKEADDSVVALAAMCPTAPLWQTTVRQIVLRLFNECGVKGVYIDQVAAARPQLCFDRAHGHPLGGGHWWREGYASLLRPIRESMGPDHVLTTECSAEPYLDLFDGYLTWNWQYDGQVPVFPAVYGGAIQMFGRKYNDVPADQQGARGDAALAMRMKAGQQLVFGEQLGWLKAAQAREGSTGEFFRQLAKLRYGVARYFYAGEMARPPRPRGDVPRVTADWQWQGHRPVTTDALLTGAWRIPGEKKLLMLVVNVSDQPVRARLYFDPAAYGLTGGKWSCRRIAAEGAAAETFDPVAPSAPLRAEFVAPPRQAWAWEISPRSPQSVRKRRSFLSAAPGDDSSSKTLTHRPDLQAIRQVLAGKRHVASAAWWGFDDCLLTARDKDDANRIHQGA